MPTLRASIPRSESSRIDDVLSRSRRTTRPPQAAAVVVDVAGPVFDPPGEEEVDEGDDRGIARLVQEVPGLLDLGDEAVRGLFVHLLEELLGRAPAEVVGQ